ncbi:MAG: flagellar basal body rod protein FlgC [Rhizobiales bacterium 17-65-6]|nr:MAG: flagellar basal body rod protein FlgC [Rhizobiales bacterium 12-68-15]OYX83819.1 MAG: flagellar basal body rod protein FlgC [Azorhizobium sp. 35-67-5]OYX90119.1 MAG: flagellar basal body rod protein FlgC [Azorhizobium sp. 32-67-21]OYZ98927.1 MAG: flagellar basal body rod protein FlgC [Rhizobiales bacterium 17-65-6]
MIDPLKAATAIASSGIQAQSTRMRVVSENIANARSTGAEPGSEPYTRKTVLFSQMLDRTLGANVVKVKSTEIDKTPFPVEHDPGNPAANAEGMVKVPNVNISVEMADMREAGRSYSANLQMVKQVRNMVAMTIDLLRS